MIIHTFSVIVPQTESVALLEDLRCSLLPKCETAKGLVSVWVSKRDFVAYVEVSTVSIWDSEEALAYFMQGDDELATKARGLVSLEPRTFDVLYSWPSDPGASH